LEEEKRPLRTTRIWPLATKKICELKPTFGRGRLGALRAVAEIDRLIVRNNTFRDSYAVSPAEYQVVGVRG